MFLKIGDRERIDDPTPEQILHAFRVLSNDTPYLILDADEEQFVQAAPEGAQWRVEWRQESRQQYMLTTLENAEAVFLSFRQWDEPKLRNFPWKRLDRSIAGRYGFVLMVVVLALLALFKALGNLR